MIRTVIRYRTSRSRSVLLDGGGRPIRVTTNDKGEFLRAGIPVQMYRVSFELEGWEPLQAMVTVSNGGQSLINETLHPLPEGVLSQAQADPGERAPAGGPGRLSGR